MTLHDIRRSLFIIVSTAAVLLAAVAPATAAERVKYVPFKAGMVITEYLGPPSAECFAEASGGSAATGSISGSGLATAVGAFSVASQDCITSASPVGLIPPLTFSSKQVVLRATNGDQLVAEYEGTANTQPDGLLVLSGTFTFTSGTGRFTGVKGTGTLEGVEDISTNPARGFVVLTGRISR